MRIQFFVNFIHTQGTYFRFHNLAIGLSQLGHTVTVHGIEVSTKARKRVETVDGIDYHILPTSRGLSVLSYFNHPLNALRRVWAGVPAADVAHLFQPFASAAAPWLRSRAALKVFDWDDLWVGGLWSGPLRSVGDGYERLVTALLERSLPRRADLVTTCSRYLAELAEKRGARRVAVVPNGLWPAPFMPKGEARRQLGLRENGVYAGFMGRTWAELSWCFDALQKTAPAHPSLRLAVCGPPADCLDQLSTKVRERIDYLGELSPAQTRTFAAAIDLGLLPLEDTAFNRSRFPIKYAEYMAAGAPVLCSRVGDCAALSKTFPWVVDAGTTPQEWNAAFAGAVAVCEAGRLPAVDQRRIEATFSWSQLAQRLVDAYREAMPAPPAF